LNNTLFPTQEIGSIAKPNWHVKKLRGKPLSEQDINDAKHWAKTLNIHGTEELISLLKKKTLSPKEKQKVKDWSQIYAIKLFEESGLDIIYGGEQWRSEMYQHAVDYIKGLKFYGEVRSWDNKYYLKAAVVKEPKLLKPYHLDEFNFIKENTKKPLKVPITGAYTIAEWSFNEYYTKKLGKKIKNNHKLSFEARKELAVDIGKNILRPTIKKLIEEGANFIQIDEPAATTHPDETQILVDSFNESVKGLNAKFSIHICFSDYSVLFPKILEMPKNSQYALEFANKDNPSHDIYREILGLLKQYNDPREVGLGVLDVHRDSIEAPELVKERIVFAADFLGDSKRISVSPDCGLRTRSWDVVHKKLVNMVKGTEMARKHFEH